MSTFSVFVEGPVDTAEGALDRLAVKMSSRYGLPASELVTRLARGRFRVKANIDRATADVYVKDLTAIGARAIVEEGRASQPSLPIANIPAAPPPRATTPPPTYVSGLAAAFAPSEAKMDLGALGGDQAEFKLADIDGGVAPPRVKIRTPAEGYSTQPEPSADAFAPPSGSDDALQLTDVTPQPATAPRGAKATKAPATASAPAASQSPNEPFDMFAPPDAGDMALAVEIAPDEIEYRKSKVSIPPVNVAPAASPVQSAAVRESEPRLQPTPREPRTAGTSGILAQPRARLVVGVAIAIVLGFIPAHVVGIMREHSAFQSIDMRIQTRQSSVSTAEEIDALDTYRASELAAKKSARNNIALVSMLIWAAVGGAFSYIWFRRIPWDR